MGVLDRNVPTPVDSLLYDQSNGGQVNPLSVQGAILSNVGKTYLQKSLEDVQSGARDQNSGKPISQQTFSMDMPSANPSDLLGGFTVTPTYVQGVGVLGADIGGVAKGIGVAQDQILGSNKDRRENEQLGMAKVKLKEDEEYVKIAQAQLGVQTLKAANEQYTVDQGQQIMKGMGQAAQQGGYSGVINYLMQVDPNTAISFQANKLKLDDDILKNKVIQAVAPNQINQALFQSYQVGGQMASGIMKLPMDQRAAAYAQAAPLFQKIAPGAPNSYDMKADGMMNLMIAQATPANLMNANKGLAAYGQTEIGKLNMALGELNRNGAGDTPEAKQLQSLIGAKMSEAQQAGIKSMEAQTHIATQNQGMAVQGSKLALDYTKAIEADSKPFVESSEALASADYLSQQIKQMQKNGENTGLMQNMLKTNLVKLYQKGSLSDTDMENASAATGYAALDKKVISYLKGDKTTLNDNELSQATTMISYMKDRIIEKQIRKEDAWKQSIGGQVKTDSQGNTTPLIDDRHIVWPSQTYQSAVTQSLNPDAKPQPTTEQVKQQQQYSKDQIESWTNEALANGKIPSDKILQYKQQLYKQNGITQ